MADGPTNDAALQEAIRRLALLSQQRPLDRLLGGLEQELPLEATLSADPRVAQSQRALIPQQQQALSDPSPHLSETPWYQRESVIPGVKNVPESLAHLYNLTIADWPNTMLGAQAGLASSLGLPDPTGGHRVPKAATYELDDQGVPGGALPAMNWEAVKDPMNLALEGLPHVLGALAQAGHGLPFAAGMARMVTGATKASRVREEVTRLLESGETSLPAIRTILKDRFGLDMNRAREFAPDIEAAITEATGAGARQATHAGEFAGAAEGSLAERMRPDAPGLLINGKPFREASPEELEAWGRSHGFEGLGVGNPLVDVVDPGTGRTWQIPGGLGEDDTFKYADLFTIKGQGLNPNEMSEPFHARLHGKLLRTMSPAGRPSEPQLFSQLGLGLTSPNTPLTPNELELSRLRPRSMEDLREWAASIPWKAGEKAPRPVRRAAELRLKQLFGTQAQEQGGLGLKGTAEYGNLAELAQMMEKNPEWFYKRPDEEWTHYVERLQTQIRGFASKTGSFGSVWQDPIGAEVSAVDRHIAFAGYKKIFGADPAAKAAFDASLLGSWNTQAEGAQRALVDELPKVQEQIATFEGKVAQGGRGAKQAAQRLTALQRRERQILDNASMRPVSSVPELLEQDKGDSHLVDSMMSGPLGSRKLKSHLLDRATGAHTRPNPKVPERLQTEPWVVPPRDSEVSVMSEPYRTAMEAIGAEHQARTGFNVYGGQWYDWDRIRQRVEPHEVMFPGLENLPSMAFRDLAEAIAGHKTAGYFDTQLLRGVDPLTGVRTRNLKPTRPIDPRQLLYWSLLLGGGGLGATAAAQEQGGDTVADR